MSGRAADISELCNRVIRAGTLDARLSTRAIMEFLKRVAAVRGRLVTSVMLSFPSGHMVFNTGLELVKRQEKSQR